LLRYDYIICRTPLPEGGEKLWYPEKEIMSIDLHVHSTVSDGSMHPAELVALAARQRLKAIALTDHDSMEGCAAARVAGEQLGVEVIPGVELSVSFGEKNLHLLGYFCDDSEPRLQAGLQRLQNGREERNRCILKKLADGGIKLSFRELRNIAGPGLCGRPHIAKLLVKRGHVRSMDEAFSRYLASTGSAYCSRFTFSVQDAIALVTNAGGLAVLAHPGQISGDPAVIRELLRELIPYGLDGVEVFYPTHSRQFRQQLSHFAEDNALLQTGGSDYHGSIRPGTSLAGGKKVRVPAELLDKLKNRRQSVMNAAADNIY